MRISSLLASPSWAGLTRSASSDLQGPAYAGPACSCEAGDTSGEPSFSARAGWRPLPPLGSYTLHGESSCCCLLCLQRAGRLLSGPAACAWTKPVTRLSLTGGASWAHHGGIMGASWASACAIGQGGAWGAWNGLRFRLEQCGCGVVIIELIRMYVCTPAPWY